MTIGEEIWNEVRKAESDAIENDKEFGDRETILALQNALKKHGYALQVCFRKGKVYFVVRDCEGHELTFENDLCMTMEMIRKWIKEDKAVGENNLDDMMMGISPEDWDLLNFIYQESKHESRNIVKDYPGFVELEASAGYMFYGVKNACVLLNCLFNSYLNSDIPDKYENYKKVIESITSGLQGVIELLENAESSGQNAMDIIDKL